MIRLEIIHLRSPGEPVESLTERISESIREGGEEASTLTLFRRQGLETDLAVHIVSPDDAMKTGPSDLALRLASELRAYGLVEHTVWEGLTDTGAGR
jgi:hypothetical protein